MAHILIIEDDNQIRLLLRMLCESEGHTVTEASNGVEGIYRYRESHVDLVLTDIVMPDKEGLETIRFLKKVNPEAKIIAMSGCDLYRQNNYLDLAKLFGAIHTLTKPFHKNDVLGTIRQFI